MGQIKIYGLESNIENNRKKISNAIHSCVVEAFKFPEDKRFHRFIKLEKEDFIYPDSRTDKYIIIEIVCMEGRSDQSKKELIKLLFKRLGDQVGINQDDIEITIFEVKKQNWRIRGLPGDELELNYKVEV